MNTFWQLLEYHSHRRAVFFVLNLVILCLQQRISTWTIRHDSAIVATHVQWTRAADAHLGLKRWYVYSLLLPDAVSCVCLVSTKDQSVHLYTSNEGTLFDSWPSHKRAPSMQISFRTGWCIQHTCDSCYACLLAESVCQFCCFTVEVPLHTSFFCSASQPLERTCRSEHQRFGGECGVRQWISCWAPGHSVPLEGAGELQRTRTGGVFTFRHILLQVRSRPW